MGAGRHPAIVHGGSASAEQPVEPKPGDCTDILQINPSILFGVIVKAPAEVEKFAVLRVSHSAEDEILRHDVLAQRLSAEIPIVDDPPVASRAHGAGNSGLLTIFGCELIISCPSISII